MTVKINGTDISSLIAINGIKWSSSDIDGPDAGRSLDGKMWRNRVTSKVKLEVSCIPMNLASLRSLLNLLTPEYVTVQYYDPIAGTTLTKTMYSSSRKAAYLLKSGNTELWEDISFSLIER